MSENGDGDRILNLAGLALVGFLVIAVGVFVLAGGFAQSDASDRTAPRANWSTERVNDTHVRLVHAGGDPIQADDLIVVVGSTDRGIRKTERLVVGESITVAAPRNEKVVLYWKGEEYGRRVKLGSWDRIPGS
jgi:hypothetical protein